MPSESPAEPRPVQANGASSVNPSTLNAASRRFWGVRVSEAIPEKITNKETDFTERRFADSPRSEKPMVVTASREAKPATPATPVADRAKTAERPVPSPAVPQATRTLGVKTATQFPTDGRTPLNRLKETLTRVDWAGGTRVPSDLSDMRPTVNNINYRSFDFTPKTSAASQIKSSPAGARTISTQKEARSFPESRNVLRQPGEHHSPKIVATPSGDNHVETVVKNGRVNAAEVSARERAVFDDSPRSAREIPRLTTPQVGMAETHKLRELAIESRSADGSRDRQSPESPTANRWSRMDRSPNAAGENSGNAGREADQRNELPAHKSRPVQDQLRSESQRPATSPMVERPAQPNVQPATARTMTESARKLRGQSDTTRPIMEAVVREEASRSGKTTAEHSSAPAQTTSGAPRSTGPLFTMPSAPLRPHLTAEQVRELQQLVARAVQNTRANAIGESTTRFNLQHASLGLLQFRISTRRDDVAIEISSASHEVTEALDESRPAMERVIADLGMRIERFEVRLREPAALQDNWGRGFQMDREPKRDAAADDSRPALYADPFSMRDEEESLARRPLLAEHEWVA
ncbi:flagellar hook-length control protein FliK [bacterium]|nr:flagellar hook-length control protein FliK [bacterium]MBU1983901.1 flagellar hook-length control protein FliK [bacterium]